MKKLFFYTAIIVVSILGFSQVSDAINGEDQNADSINWITIEEAQKLNKTAPRKIFIDVYTDWCGPCKLMAKKTLSKPHIVKYVNENFYAVKFNAEGKLPLTFNGNVFENHGITHDFTKYLGATGYPTVAFFDSDNSPIMKFTAYMKADEFEDVLNYINNEIYKKQAFEDFTAE